MPPPAKRRQQQQPLRAASARGAGGSSAGSKIIKLAPQLASLIQKEERLLVEQGYIDLPAAVLSHHPQPSTSCSHPGGIDDPTAAALAAVKQEQEEDEEEGGADAAPATKRAAAAAAKKSRCRCIHDERNGHSCRGTESVPQGALQLHEGRVHAARACIVGGQKSGPRVWVWVCACG